MAKQPKTYTSPIPVYVDNVLYPAGDPFTTNAPKGSTWKEVKSAAERRALESSGDFGGGDVPLESMTPDALKALAATKNVNTADLKSKKDLITAIKAANEPSL